MAEAPQWNDMKVSRREKREPTRRDLMQSLGPWAVIGAFFFFLGGWIIDMTIGFRMQERRAQRARYSFDPDRSYSDEMTKPPPTHVPPLPRAIAGAVVGVLFACGAWYVQKENWKKEQARLAAKKKKKKAAQAKAHPMFQNKG